MAVTEYYTVNGKLMGETGPNGDLDYMTDALGSVTGTLSSTGTVQNTYHYKPYGALLVRVGAFPDPAFLWAGFAGYSQTGRIFSELYVRARHFTTPAAAWSTKSAAPTPRHRGRGAKRSSA